MAEGAACHKLSLKNTKAADHPGDWRVEIFLDNTLAGTDTFSIRQIKQKNPVEDFSKINFGNYYALIIGNNRYTSLKKLKCAKEDAKAVAGILEKLVITDFGEAE